MRIALAQLNPTIADWDGLATRMRAMAEEAKAQGAQCMVYPELATIGYPPRDLLDRPAVVERQWLLVQELARTLCLPALIGCVEPLHEGPAPLRANALVVVAGGEIVTSYRKRLLPTYDVFDERRYFRPGDGPAVVELCGMRFGLTICEDIWSEDFSGLRYRHDPVGELTGRCDVLVSISASPYCMGRPQLRGRLVSTVAKRVGVPVVYVNQVGGQDELLFDGGSCVVGPDGAWYAQAARWREELVIADLNRPIAAPATIDEPADIWNGLVCGIRDYCFKTGQRGVVLGLSGGIDSAVVAALAADALGADKVHGLLMPGPYSSQGSIDDALDLAQRLGVRHYTLPIGEAYQAHLAALAPAFVDTQPGLAEENLQARIRGNLVMAYANKHALMALTTGNKSELACGYCTIYGDMNGGLAPLGDVYKTLVWDLARWRNSQGQVIPVASIEKPPSAELRPNQKDSDSLPEYAVLDRIVQQFVERQRSAEQIIASGEDAALVRRVLRLVEINEYKRRQAAPSLRITSKAFGVGRRIPLSRAMS